LISATGILFYPIFISILIGQDTIFILLGALLWMQALEKEQDNLAGIGLGLMLLRPQIALIFSLPLLFTRRKAWWWFCAVASFISLFSLVLINWDGLQDFIQLMVISAKGNGYGLNQVNMHNFTGLILRSFPTIDKITLQWLKWGIYFVAIIGLCYLWWRRKDRLNAQLIGATVLLGVFTSPHLHFHDISLLILPGLAVVLPWAKTDGWNKARALIVLPAISLLLIFTHFITSVWFYRSVYMIMIVLGISLWFTVRNTR
jgi:hypothetical protein